MNINKSCFVPTTKHKHDLHLLRIAFVVDLSSWGLYIDITICTCMPSLIKQIYVYTQNYIYIYIYIYIYKNIYIYIYLYIYVYIYIYIYIAEMS